MAMASNLYRSFAEFWPYYAAGHSHPGTRRLHFVGTVRSLFCLILALIHAGRMDSGIRRLPGERM